MRRPVIGVVGSGEAGPSSQAAARELGRLIAERGWVLLTGGRPAGVMAEACAGAKQVAGSLTLGILPSASGGVGPDVDLAVFTGMGDARNAVNVLSSDVVVACGVEGPGTASEVALGLVAAKPVILLSASPAAMTFFQELPCAGRLHLAESAPEAVRLIEEVLQVPRGPGWA
ncbi:MAG TPA: hypothetical protein VH763_09260 [Gemmatimonadales bacterium]|jgi:uncharacterized protein (TIGR00725 family)